MTFLCFTDDKEPEKINQGTSDEIAIRGYQADRLRLSLTVVGCVLTGGLLLLLLTWKPSVKLWFTHKTCSLTDATKILCTDVYGQEWEEELVLEDNQNIAYSAVSLQSKSFCKRYFVNKKIKYVWDVHNNVFSRLRSKESQSSLQGIYSKRGGLFTESVTELRKLHGENFIQIEVSSVPQLILQQIKNPFYVFQLYTVILWCLQLYYVFAICIALLSVLSIASSVWETRRQSASLRSKMTSQGELIVIRNGNKVTLSSRDVVPGDVVVLEAGMVLEMDAVLIEGAVVVSEAVLTGESVPITKTGLTEAENMQQMLSETGHKRHILYSGSEVMQVRGASDPQVVGVVLNTGFSTSRGELVRSILFPKPIAFHLYTDFLKMLFFFALLGFGAMAGSVYMWLHSEPPATWQEIVFNSLDLLTFVIPPILPATMTAINVWAQRRLKKMEIYCLSSNYVSLAGPVDVVCFDKTGTLTEDDLEVAGVFPFSPDGNPQKEYKDLLEIPAENWLFTVALGSCHTLAGRQPGGPTQKVLGHPMDIKIFNSLHWELEARNDGCINQTYGLLTPVLLRPLLFSAASILEVAQLKTYPFDSNEQRMTVLAKIKGSNEIFVLIKGAAEALKQTCYPEQVPRHFDEILTWYSLQGLRVVAVAGRSWTGSYSKVEKMPRKELESGCQLLGFVLFNNPIKPETPRWIETLQEAQIDTVMITGDNLATAISVARSCGLVKEFEQMVIVRAQVTQSPARTLKVTYHEAFTPSSQTTKNVQVTIDPSDAVLVMDGQTWSTVRDWDKKLLQRLALRGRVFARMKPDQKVQVIEELRDLGRHVAMCGDGCNDCGALKAAHVGISLASTEASVAAPFTSKHPSIECVHKLIREGRATLVSTYASFKYNISYGFAALIVVMILFSIQNEPSDTQYLIMDLVLITVPSLVLGNTGAPDTLEPERPTRRILHPLHITSILSFLLIQSGAYWLCFCYTMQQPWFEPYVFFPGKMPPDPSYESTTLVIFSFYTFIIGAFCFSHSKPFRKPFYTNIILTAYLLLATVCVIFFTFFSGEGFLNFMNFTNIPHNGFRWLLLIGAVLNLLICYVWERLFLYGVVANVVMPWLNRVLPPRRPYQKLEKEIQKDFNWLTITDPDDIKDTTEIGMPSIDQQDADEDTDQVLMMRRLSRRVKFHSSVHRAPDSSSTSMSNKPQIKYDDCLTVPTLPTGHLLASNEDSVSSSGLSPGNHADHASTENIYVLPVSSDSNEYGEYETPYDSGRNQNYHQHDDAAHLPLEETPSTHVYSTLDFATGDGHDDTTVPLNSFGARPPSGTHYASFHDP